MIIASYHDHLPSISIASTSRHFDGTSDGTTEEMSTYATASNHHIFFYIMDNFSVVEIE